MNFFFNLTNKKFKQLKNKFDRTGKLKTGDDLQIAELLTNYDKLTKDFHDYEEVPGKFEGAFAAFEAEILNRPDHAKGSVNYLHEMQTWLSQNTQVEVHANYYELRTAKLERRKFLLAKLDEKNAQTAGLNGIIDSTILFEEIDILCMQETEKRKELKFG